MEAGRPSELILKGGEFGKMSQECSGTAEIWSRQEQSPPRALEKAAIEPGSRRSLVNVKADGAAARDCRPLLPFPVAAKNFVLLDCSSSKYIIDDYGALDEKSKRALEEAIKANVLVFRIRTIKSVDIKGDELVWELDTDHGLRTASTRGRRNVILLGDKAILIDVLDNVYEIDMSTLDKKSKERLLRRSA